MRQILGLISVTACQPQHHALLAPVKARRSMMVVGQVVVVGGAAVALHICFAIMSE